jgi:uncharacterized protein YegP (UPF0339 family)
MNFEVYRKSPLLFGDQWQWRLRTSSGEVVARSASYPDITTCMRAIVLVKKKGLQARVVNPKNGLTFVGVDHETALIGHPVSDATPPAWGIAKPGGAAVGVRTGRRATDAVLARAHG